MEKYMVSNTIKYSDGTETVLNYVKNPEGEVIEAEVAQAIEDVSAPVSEIIEEVA